MNTEALSLMKLGLAEHLEKQGSSLEEFEALLAKGTTPEQCVEKLGGIMDILGSLVSGAGHAALKIPEAVVALSLIGGTTLGGGLYAGNKYVSNQNKRLQEKENEVGQMQNLTDRLKTDYNIQ
jgi:hypothetical protein